MQDAAVTSHFWAWLVGAFFTGATVFGGIYKLFLERKKPEAEIHLSNAQREETLAKARKLDVDSNKTAAEMMIEMIRMLRAAEQRVDKSEREKETERCRREECERERNELRRENKLLKGRLGVK